MTSRPSACTASTVHDLTGSPSSSTVQAPQCVVSQPMCVPVSRRFSRRKWTRRRRDSTSASCARAVDRDPDLVRRHRQCPPARSTACARARARSARAPSRACTRPRRADRPSASAACAASRAASAIVAASGFLPVQERLGLGRLDRRRPSVGQADAGPRDLAARAERDLRGRRGGGEVADLALELQVGAAAPRRRHAGCGSRSGSRPARARWRRAR